jgi:hypothetical protein
MQAFRMMGMLQMVQVLLLTTAAMTGEQSGN